MRRLTAGQTAVLAAVERLDAPTFAELARELGAPRPRDLHRILEALVRRGLVGSWAGREDLPEAGIRWWSTRAVQGEADDAVRDAVVRLRAARVAFPVREVRGDELAVEITIPMEDVRMALLGTPRRPAAHLAELLRALIAEHGFVADAMPAWDPDLDELHLTLHDPRWWGAPDAEPSPFGPDADIPF